MTRMMTRLFSTVTWPVMPYLIKAIEGERSKIKPCIREQRYAFQDSAKQIFLSFDRPDEGTLIFYVGIVSSVAMVLVGTTNTVVDDGQNLHGGDLLCHCKHDQYELPAKKCWKCLKMSTFL